ncbi:hypothetical protein BBJ28_00012745 [Nothophytophthora sp. Chile5]|nr:hypothetical protein BBJ28_00012745 [Nothophytophthora sp. Chile5]
MNEYPPLVSKALELLLQQYNQHDQLLKEMENVQLLVTDETITIYNKLKGDVDDLRRLAETTEVWMDLTSRSDFEKADSVCQLLGSLMEVIQHTKAGESSGESPKPRRAHRELRISSPEKAASGDESDEEDDKSMGDLLGTSPKCAPKHVQLAEGDDHKPTIRYSIEKQPPNRRLVHSRDHYILNPAFGRVSRHSGCHGILPLLSNDRIGFVTEDASAEDGAATEGNTLAVEAQRLLRNLRAAQFVLNMLRDGAHFFEGHFEVERPEFAHAPSSPTTRSRTKLQTRQRDQIRAVFAQGMQFLCAFCMGDAENQALVAPHATMIAQYAGELSISQELLVAIYTDNFPLYRAVPTELINMFVGRLVNDDPNPRYLLFLETLVMCNERPVIENQLLVLFQLVKSLENSKVLQAFDEAARTVELLGELFQRHAQCLSDGSEGDKRPELETAASATQAITLLPILLTSTNTTSESHSPTAADCHNGASIAELLEYHVRLLHLFAACATGKNTRVQEICQQILPLLNVVDLLRHANCTEGIQLALLRYLDQVFLTADEIETPGVDDLVQILMVLSEVCETRVTQFLRLTQVKDVNRLATLSLRKNKTKFGGKLGLTAQSPVESAPLYLVLFSAIPTLFSFLQQFPRLFETSEEAHHYLFHAHQCVALLLTVCAANKWHVSEDAVAIIEEFVYLMDKTVRVDMLEDPVLPQASLEQSWSASLKYPERLDCSSMDFEQDLPYLLQWALSERDKDRSSDADDAVSVSDKVGGHTRVLRNISELSSATAAVHNASLSNGTWRATSVHGGASSSNGTVGIEGATYKKAGGDTSIQDALIPSAIPDRLDITRPAVWGANAAVSRGKNREVKQLQRKIHFSKGNRSRLTPYDAAMGPTNIVQKNHGRLLHRLSPTRFCKGLRVCGNQNSAISTSPAFSRSSPDRYRCSEGSPGPFDVEQTKDSHFFGRHQQHFHEFDQFLNWLRLHPNVHSAMRDELNQMVQGILGIEASLKDEYDPQAHLSNVRLSFDLVVSKLVAHVEALQDPSYLKTNLTLLNVFCRMIYAVEDPEECHNMQIKLNQLGVTRLVVQLIASRDNDALFASSIQVGVALLDGMNAEVQESFYNHWREAGNALFFERIQARIEKACKLIRNVDRVDLNTTSHSHGDGDVDDAFISSVELGANDGDKLRHRHSIFDLGLETPPPSTPKAGEKRGAKRLGAPITSIFRFLQLLCEGHYLNAQRALIAQPHAARSTNLVETTTSFLLDTYLALADLDMGLITQLFETITECCQGPCMEAQETVANYKFISAVNALLTHSFEQRDAQAQLAARQLRASIVITLLSLLEGRSDYVLHIQLVQELNFDALKMNLVEVYSHFLRKHGAYAGNSKCSEDFYLAMGFNIYILLQQLADRHPQQAWWIPPSKIDKFEVSLTSSTPQESTRGKVYSVGAATDGVAPDYHDAYYFFQSNCAKVEVVWDHHRSPAASNPDRGLSAGGKMDGISSIGDAGGGSGLFPDPVSTDASALIPFYFPLHPICFCLTEQSKKKLVWVVSRGVDKLSDFYARSDKLVDEMTHQSHLQHHLHISWLAKKLDRLKRVSFAVAAGINLIVLLFYRAGGIDSRPYAASQVTFIHAWGAIAEPPSPSLWIDYGLSLVGTLQIILYCMTLVCYMLNSAPLLIKKGWKRRHQAERARRSKRTAHSARLRSTESEERESFQDTERLLRSLRERENEYDYLFLPPPFRKVSATRRVLNTTSALASKTDSTKTRASSSAGDKLEGTPSLRRRLRLQLETVGVSLFFLIWNPRVLYSLWQIFIAILGSYVNKLYFAFLLLDIVDRYKEFNNVLRSIVRPAKALGMTTLLYLIVVYVFAVVGFYFFREDYTPSDTLTEDQREGRAPYTCQRLFQCFLVSLDQGLMSGGGLGSFLREIPLGTNAHSYGRLAFDVLFNILLVVLLLNLVFGVIIDTFASLRMDDQEKMLDMKSRCFICSIDAYSFDRSTKRGFHDHVSRDHNMWHYLYLFVHIRKKRITDYNGLELFLAMRMAKKDVSFFPTHRALSLETRGTLGELSEADVGLEDDRFFAGKSHCGSRRSASTPLSPTTSSVSGVARSRGRSRTSSINFQAASAVHADGYFDTVPAGKLEKMEASIATLVNAQNEMKKAHQRAEERHTELLAVITGWQQQQQRQGSFYGSSSSIPPSPADNASSLSAIDLPPAIPRRPSARVPGSTTPRIFSFDSVLDEETSDGTLESSREQNPPSLVAVALPPPISRRPGSVAPLLFNFDAMSNKEENTEGVPRAHHASR